MDNEIRKYCESCKFYSVLGCQSTLICRDGNRFIAAGIQPVKRGRWINTNTPNQLRCSCCDIIHFIAQYPHGEINYCPNCGADMRNDSNLMETEVKGLFLNFEQDGDTE